MAGTKLSAYKDRAPWAAITQLPDEEETTPPQDEGSDHETNPNQSQGERAQALRICKNAGCGKKFTEEQNHSNACHYHRGPISFGKKSTDEHKVLHEMTPSITLPPIIKPSSKMLSRCVNGQWICCDVPVPSYDDLATAPPCTRGKHYAPPPRNPNGMDPSSGNQ